MSKTMYQRALEWIDNHVPVHTKAEYYELLHRHEQIMFRLVTLEETHSALCKAHAKLEDELARSVPVPKWEARGDAYYDMAEMETRLHLRWWIDPAQQVTAIRHFELMQDRFAFDQTIPAMRRYFMERTAPALFEAAARNLARELGGVYENLRFMKGAAA